MDRELEAHAIVVRGGVKPEPAGLVDKIMDADEQGYGPVLSVYIDTQKPDETRDEAIHRICDAADIPNGKVTLSTVSNLAEDFVIEPYVEEGWCDLHCHVIFQDPVTESDASKFMDHFGDPISNPTGGKKARR